MTTLIFVALEDEFPAQMVAPHRVIYTGVGKVNAALTAAEALAKHNPTLASTTAQLGL